MSSDALVDRRFALMIGSGAALAAASAGAAGVADPALQAELSATLDTFTRRVHARDPAALDLFDPADCLLVGSAVGEVCLGRAAIRSHLEQYYTMPLRIGFSWRRTLAGREGAQAAWLWSEGELVLAGDDGATHRSPYRLTCLFTRRSGSWRIRLFSGSEPTAAG
jgi:uncharacterized protein (TIGR02246 family)